MTEATIDAVEILNKVLEQPSAKEEAGTVRALTRAETDTQIATARRFPRQVTEVLKMAVGLATFNQDIASSMFYTLKRKDKGGDAKWIIGPSIRLAEVMQNAWGNLRIRGVVVGEDARNVVTEGMAWDLERNVQLSQQNARRITTKDGRRYGDDMIIVTTNASMKIAIRNATFGIIPRALVDHVLDEAKRVATGDATTMVERRQKLFEYFTQKLQVPAAQLWAYLEVKGIEDVNLDHIAVMRGVANSLKDGETTIEEVFAATADKAARTDDVETMIGRIRVNNEDAAGAIETAFEALGTPNARQLQLLTQHRDAPLALAKLLADDLAKRGATPAQSIPAASAPATIADVPKQDAPVPKEKPKRGRPKGSKTGKPSVPANWKPEPASHPPIDTTTAHEVVNTKTGEIVDFKPSAPAAPSTGDKPRRSI